MDFAETIENLEGTPLIGILIKILKKVGFLKDHKRLYQTENKIKALGNSLKRIDVPLEKILQSKKIEIPCLILFRQKDDENLKSSKLKEIGFKVYGRTMGMYILPPSKVVEYNIKDKESIRQFLAENFGLDESSKVNIRFCMLIDLNKQYFSFRHKSIINNETKPIFEFVQEDIIRYIGNKNSLRYVREYYKKEWTKKESELIGSTPLQHILCNFIDNSKFDILVEKEDQILDEMIKRKYLDDRSFLSLSKISKKNFKKILIEFLEEIEDIDEVCKNSLDQAEFMANRL